MRDIKCISDAKITLSYAHRIKVSLVRFLPGRNIHFDTFVGFCKGQLSMCWKVAISCKAHEADGVHAVPFLIPPGTQFTLPPGCEASVLEQEVHKRAVRKLTTFS